MERGIAINVTSHCEETFSNVPVMSTSLDSKGRTIGVALIRGIMVEIRQSSKDWRKWAIIDEQYEELEELEVHHCVTPWGHDEDIADVVCELKKAYHCLSMPIEHWRIPYATKNTKHQRVYKCTSDGELVLAAQEAIVHTTHIDENGKEHGYTVIGPSRIKLMRADEISWVF